VDGKDIVYRLQTLDKCAFSRRRNVELIRTRASTKALSSHVHEDFPPVAHPAVFVQPETGRRVLNISPLFSESVLGLPEDESEALLEELTEHIAACPSYSHKWAAGDMILWDNWRMVHSVSGAPLDEVRIMQRTTIGGDYGLGRTLRNGAFQ